MFSRMFSRSVTSRMVQSRSASTFNRYPVLKVRPYGISGNTYLLIGVVSLITTTYFVQKSGYLIPRVPGGGIRSPQGRIPMDLTPNKEE